MTDEPSASQPPPPPSPYQNPVYPYYASPYLVNPLKHSGVGIASFIIGVAIAILELAAISLATAMVLQRRSAQDPLIIGAGCGMLLGLAACLLGVVLGIIGMYQADRKKIFAVLGTCINGIILLGVLGLMVIGLLKK